MTISFNSIPQCAGKQPFAECCGVDLSGDLSTQETGMIKAGLLEHGLLLFRGQNALTPQREVAFNEVLAGMIRIKVSICSVLGHQQPNTE